MSVALWITGLPGSGKSTIAEAFLKKHPEFVVLRIDELRQIVTPEPTYSDNEREYVYRALVFTAKKLQDAGLNVIIDATGNMRRWRELARKIIDNFKEVHLRCEIETCIKREVERKKLYHAPRDIYKKASEGWPVPGVNVPYEEPLHPELIIDTEHTSVDEAVVLIEGII